MVDEVPASNGQAVDPNAPQFAPQAVYVKDVSFESPAGPRLAP
ncbi:MAG: protein-export chaperone SecB, partial [Proteobacteria bacterium]|nr:protein-export chaperone SecB [Pseudomonadota bacterium]